jgi:hypothetical protein
MRNSGEVACAAAKRRCFCERELAVASEVDADAGCDPLLLWTVVAATVTTGFADRSGTERIPLNVTLSPVTAKSDRVGETWRAAIGPPDANCDKRLGEKKPTPPGAKFRSADENESWIPLEMLPPEKKLATDAKKSRLG